MAKQTITMLTDDLDGSAADESLTFGFDGTLYEIDLSTKNAKVLREFIQRYTDAGTRRGRLSPAGAAFSTGGRNIGGGATPKVDREQNTAIRHWAARNGYETADRGRIPQHIVDAYHRGTPAPAKANDLLQDLLPETAPEPVKADAAAKKAAPAAKKAAPAAKKAAPAKATRSRAGAWT